MPGKVISVATPDGGMDCYVTGPDTSAPVVVFFMDGFGYRRTLTDMADRLAARGVRVVLPNLYYRHGSVPPVDIAAAIKPGPEQARMMQYYQSLTPALALSDLDALLHSPSCAAAVERGVGCLGYCMGGAFAVAAAGALPNRVVAAVSVHGGGLVTGTQDSPDRRMADIKGYLYLALAGVDPYFSAEQAQTLASKAYTAGLNCLIETYSGAHHGFAVADVPAYNAGAAQRHWRRIESVFDEAFSLQ
jgi:carboxymethylenebutenolidase